MKIQVLGSGAYPLRFHDGKSLSLFLPEHGVLIDAGLGLPSLPKEYKTETLHILLSHFHHDHILGLAFLANILENGQCQKIVIHGDERIEQLMTFFKEPFNPDYTSEMMPITMEYLPEESEFARLKIKRMNVPHASGKSNYFTFSDGKTTWGFGTDTTADVKNASFFSGCSTLFHECNYDNANKDKATFEGHSYADAVSSLTKASGVKKLVLIHTDPRHPSLAEVKKEFSETVEASDDEIFEV